MTQLDLPQVSLQRYVDLVRRRRWQLVPISLFGLVVGVSRSRSNVFRSNLDAPFLTNSDFFFAGSDSDSDSDSYKMYR